MRYGATKKLLVGALAATFLALQVPATALAATDEEAFAAAQAGTGYLADNQNDDGSIAGFGGETDWTIIAVEASGADADELENGSGVTAVNFIETEVPADGTDVARKMLAIASTEGDSTDFGGTDYNALLASLYDDQQFDAATLLNDDMFAIMAISKTDDPELYALAQKSLDFLIANQEADGGFSYTTVECDFFCGTDSNDTAAAIIAFKAAGEIGLTHDDLETAEAAALVYLLSTQQADGGFAYDTFAGVSDGSSTSWALMALNAIGAGVETQATAARDWLLANQNDDGGFSYGAFGITASDTFTTAHAVTALLGTTWLLDPAPLVAEAPTETETPPEEEEEEEEDTTPIVTTSAEDEEQTAAQEETTEAQPEVLTTTTSAPEEPKEDDKQPEAVTPIAAKTPYGKYAIYAALILGALLLGWYAFRPKAGKA